MDCIGRRSARGWLTMVVSMSGDRHTHTLQALWKIWLYLHLAYDYKWKSIWVGIRDRNLFTELVSPHRNLWLNLLESEDVYHFCFRENSIFSLKLFIWVMRSTVPYNTWRTDVLKQRDGADVFISLLWCKHNISPCEQQGTHEFVYACLYRLLAFR